MQSVGRRITRNCMHFNTKCDQPPTQSRADKASRSGYQGFFHGFSILNQLVGDAQKRPVICGGRPSET
jgi:hypothetical protein